MVQDFKPMTGSWGGRSSCIKEYKKKNNLKRSKKESMHLQADQGHVPRGCWRQDERVMPTISMLNTLISIVS